LTSLCLLLALGWTVGTFSTPKKIALKPQQAAEGAVICGDDGGCGLELSIVAVFTCAAFAGPAAIGCGLAAAA
jgi:hypothetical protein